MYILPGAIFAIHCQEGWHFKLKIPF